MTNKRTHGKCAPLKPLLASPLPLGSELVAMPAVVPAAMMAEERADFPPLGPSATTQRGLRNSCSLTLVHTTLTWGPVGYGNLTTPNHLLGFKVRTGSKFTFLIRLLGDADAEDPQTHFEELALGLGGLNQDPQGRLGHYGTTSSPQAYGKALPWPLLAPVCSLAV